MKFSQIGSKRRQLISILGITILWAIIYLPSLSLPDASRNECRRILPAITMVNTGNWSVPMLNGRPYYRKPPLMNWMIATFYLITGKHGLLVSRLPTTLLVLGFALMLLFMPSDLLGFEIRILASCIFLTTIGMVSLGRTANIDPSYVCFTGAAIILWLNSWNNSVSGWKRWLPPAIPLSLGILLKGPLILFIYYVFVIVILFTDQGKRELFSLPHFVALLLTVIPFVAWSYYSRHGLSQQTAYHQSMTKVWAHEMLYRFDIGKIEFGKWAKRVLGGVAQFLPWLPAIVLAWDKKTLALLNKKEIVFVKSARRAVVILFVLIVAMPLTKARYSLPLLPLISITAALLLVKIPEGSGWFRSISKILSPVSWFILGSTVILFIGFCVAKTFNFSTGSESEEFRKVLFGMVSSSSFLITVTPVLAVAFFLAFRKNRFRLNTAFSRFIFLAVAIGILANSYFVYVLPLAAALKPGARAVANEIDAFYGKNKYLYLVNTGEIPFAIFLHQKWRTVDRFYSIKLPVKNIMTQKGSLKALDRYKKKYSLHEVARKNISFRSHNYVLVKLEPNR